MPKFSILIPIIKGKFLKTAIESVLAQSFSDWELILYNDHSSDNIDEIVTEYLDNKIKYSKGEKNLGAEDPSKVWNKMLSMASGEYICLLGDDDSISKSFLEEMEILITKYPKTSVFRAKLKRINEAEIMISEVSDLPEFETWDESFYQRVVGKRMQSTSEFVIKKEALQKIGGYVNFPRACGSDDATYLLLMKENGIASTNKAFACWRKSDLNISDNDSTEMNDYKIRFVLEWERTFLDEKFSQKVPLSALYKSIDDYLNSGSIQQRERAFQTLSEELNKAQSELNRIYASSDWQLVLLLHKAIEFFIPNGSSRRKLAAFLFQGLKSFAKIILKIKRKIWELFLRCQNLFIRFKPRKKRRINLKSKKIAYIDHSYHNKTKSSAFLLSYLEEHFDVEVIFDDSWNGQSFPDLSFIDESYLGVIFFQSLPNQKALNTIKNVNLIFIPMYDGVRHDYEFWNRHRNLKIINFSRTLHKKLEKWGLESICVQYFPAPQKFTPGNKDEVFFWQRLSRININTITKLFGTATLKMHVHKAIDPREEFIEPSKSDEQKFQITYSDWFETREEMWDVIKQKGLYIAPRELEGIGSSFLEAMAMGKAIIAIDNPTMNEYIEHDKTGYLFKLKNPKEISLANIEEVQKNTHAYMQAGYEKWMIERKNIITFIKES